MITAIGQVGLSIDLFGLYRSIGTGFHRRVSCDRTRDERKSTMRKLLTFALSGLFAVATLSGCDRSGPSQAPTPSSGAATPSSSPTPPSSTAGSSAAPAEQKSEAHPPAQGQVDARTQEQRKDFERSGK
jgi:hypothetical protein